MDEIKPKLRDVLALFIAGFGIWIAHLGTKIGSKYTKGILRRELDKKFTNHK